MKRQYSGTDTIEIDILLRASNRNLMKHYNKDNILVAQAESQEDCSVLTIATMPSLTMQTKRRTNNDDDNKLQQKQV